MKLAEMTIEQAVLMVNDRCEDRIDCVDCPLNIPRDFSCSSAVQHAARMLIAELKIGDK